MPVQPVGADTTTGQLPDVVEARLSASTALALKGLDRFKAKLDRDPATTKIALVGDSTRDSGAAGVQFHNGLKQHIAPGQLLEGMLDANVYNGGVNGATVQAITDPTHMAALTTANPDLAEVSMGINNITATDLTVDQLVTILVAGFEAIRAAIPGVPIIATIPNPFLTTDTGDHYVSPNAQAQAKSTILRSAYLRLVGRWPDVTVRDTAAIFGTVSLATSTYMADQIHPSSVGAGASADALATLIGRIVPPVQALQAAAKASQPYTPWVAYGRVVEDPADYKLVAAGIYQNGTGGSFVDFAYPYTLRGNIAVDDLVELPNGTTFKIAGSLGTPGNNLTRIADSGVPSTAGLPGGRGLVRIYRRARSADQAVNDALADTSYAFKKVGRVSGGNTAYVDVVSASITAARQTEKASAWVPPSGLKVFVEGYGSNPISGAAGGANGDTYRLYSGLDGTTDWGTYTGRLVVFAA